MTKQQKFEQTQSVFLEWAKISCHMCAIYGALLPYNQYWAILGNETSELHQNPFVKNQFPSKMVRIEQHT